MVGNLGLDGVRGTNSEQFFSSKTPLFFAFEYACIFLKDMLEKQLRLYLILILSKHHFFNKIIYF